MPRSTAQMTGCSMRDVAERAVVVDDPQLVVAAVGVRGEPVGGERVGDGVRCADRIERCPAARSSPASPAAIAAPYSAPDLLGHRLGLGRRQAAASARPSSVSTRSSAAHRALGELPRRRRGSASTAGRRREPSAFDGAPRGSRRRRACRGGGGRRSGAPRTRRRRSAAVTPRAACSRTNR